MALIHCTKCGHLLSTTAPKCPGCGSANRDMEVTAGPKISIIVSVVIGSFLLGFIVVAYYKIPHFEHTPTVGHTPESLSTVEAELTPEPTPQDLEFPKLQVRLIPEGNLFHRFTLDFEVTLLDEHPAVIQRVVFNNRAQEHACDISLVDTANAKVAQATVEKTNAKAQAKAQYLTDIASVKQAIATLNTSIDDLNAQIIAESNIPEPVGRDPFSFMNGHETPAAFRQVLAEHQKWQQKRNKWTEQRMKLGLDKYTVQVKKGQYAATKERLDELLRRGPPPTTWVEIANNQIIAEANSIIVNGGQRLRTGDSWTTAVPFGSCGDHIVRVDIYTDRGAGSYEF